MSPRRRRATYHPSSLIAIRYSLRVARLVALLAALTVVPPGSLQAQIWVTRTVSPPSLDAPGADAAGWLADARFAAEAHRGYGSRDDELAWTIRTIGAIDLWRRPGRDALTAVLTHELDANRRNETRFNPRGSQYEESLVYTRRAHRFDWFAGTIYRCRHGVDDAAEGPGDRRVVILGGVQAGLLSRERRLGARTRGMAQLRVDGYPLMRRDVRSDASRTGEPNWAHATFSAHSMVRVTHTLGEATAAYLRASGSVTHFSRGEAVLPGGRIEAGVRLPGRAAALDLFLSAERLPDDYARGEPRGAGVVTLGVRLASVAMH